MVPASGYSAAREVLLQAELAGNEQGSAARPSRVLAGLLAAVSVVALITWIGTRL
jgi:hypothetical protein